MLLWMGVTSITSWFWSVMVVVNNQRDSTQPNLRAAMAPQAPPRFLFWLVIGLFVIAVVAAILAFFIYRSEGRFISLAPLAVFVLILIPLYTLALAVIFRRSLPGWFPIGIAVFFALLAGAGWVFGTNYYRDQLPPRFQAELITPFPFLRQFLPPTPVGGALPTAAATLDSAALDLLLGSGATATVTATTTPAATATPQPTLTPTVQATATTAPTEAAIVPTSAPLPTIAPAVQEPAFNTPQLPVSAYNGGFVHARQTWNNCGPANAAMALSFYGWDGDQQDAAAYLKPDQDDKNVSPGEIVRFINEQTFVRALTRIGGDLELVKSFVAAGFPVIVEVGGQLYEGWDWIGHYRTVVGYDDSAGTMLVYDSWLGQGENGDGYPVAYRDFDVTWQAFNRIFIVVYEPSREGEVQRLLGERADVRRAAEIALETAQEEARQEPQNPFVWFNIGASLTRLGEYDRAALAFDEATRFSPPFRITWYQFYPFEAYFNAGRYSDVIALVNSNLNNGGDLVEETHYWQGRVLQAQGDTTGARSAYQRALARNPRFIAAQDALNALG
jgi:hypothetical protein